jgi:tetratricopeptide (TPR) repeat protein
MKALGLVVVLAGVARADGASDLFSEGRALLAQGKAAEACGKFEEALKLEPGAPGVLLNLGLCNAQQHKLATALRWFRKAASSGQSEVETAASQQITTLTSLVPTIRVEAQGAVTIDDAAVDTTRPIEIDAGHHVAVVGSEQVPFDVEEGAREKVIDLYPHRPPPPPPPSKTPWIVGGVGVGLLATSLTLCLVGKSEFDGTHDVDTRQHWKDVVLYGGTGTFIAGVAAIGTAAVWLKVRSSEKVVVAPVAAPDHVGVAVGGSF